MGADLFGSYVATVLAAMVLGVYVVRDMGIATKINLVVLQQYFYH